MPLRSGICPEIELTPEAHVAVSLEILEIHEPGRVFPGLVGSGNVADHFLEHGLLAGDRQWALVGEPVLLLGLYEELLEDGVVQVRRADHKPRAAVPHADRHVSRRDIRRRPARRCRRRRHPRLVPPPPQHLAEPHYDYQLWRENKKWTTTIE
ncbi:hypothetical protein Tsubulata_034228 [Turnera subulata]|uniref:Uncharacterized protein n=1 Tax=Turnera subulata TaxID=218843 RepID=A0A9Q0F1G1_9ROSI|nr:hypothetical protein Tsubulata_034228 [Turnera subulata]